jgi:hypothetical protein
MALNSAKAKLQAVENGLNDSEKQRANLELSMIQMQQQESLGQTEVLAFEKFVMAKEK